MRSTWLTTPWSSWTAWSNLSWRGRGRRARSHWSATLSRDTPAAGWATATDPAVIAARLRLMRPPHARVAQHSTRAVVQPSVAEIGARSVPVTAQPVIRGAQPTVKLAAIRLRSRSSADVGFIVPASQRRGQRRISSSWLQIPRAILGSRSPGRTARPSPSFRGVSPLLVVEAERRATFGTSFRPNPRTSVGLEVPSHSLLGEPVKRRHAPPKKRGEYLDLRLP